MYACFALVRLMNLVAWLPIVINFHCCVTPALCLVQVQYVWHPATCVAGIVLHVEGSICYSMQSMCCFTCPNHLTMP